MNQSLPNLYKRLSLAAAICICLASVLSAAAWYGAVESLNIFKPIPFLAYFAAGCSLLLAHTRAKAGHVLSTLIAALTAIYCTLELAYAFGLGWVTDNAALSALIEHINAAAGPLPGSDAAAVLILSTALAVSTVKLGRFRPAELLCAIAVVACLMALMGVFFGVPSFCLFVSCLRIAVINSIIFGATCMAILFAHPDDGLISIMASESAGGELARRLIPPALLVPLILGAIKNWGQTLGWFSPETGLTLIIVLLIVLYLVLFGYNARHIDLLDRRNKLLTAQLAQSERRIRATVEQANDPLITVDKHGSIKQWTPKAVALFGLTEAEARGKSIFDFCNESTRAEAQSMFTKAAADLSTIPHKPFEFTITAPDGRETPVEVSAFSISIDGEDMLCAFVRDITERKLIQERLNEFYYLVSHELRAPLTSIGGSIDLIESDPDSTISKSSKKFLTIAQASCQRLIKLVSDLLDVKKIELGKMNMAEEAVDLLDVVSDAVAQFESTFIQRQLKCQTVFDTTDFVTGDAERLVQVLINLLSNAIKFSPEQAMIVIKVDSPDQNRVRVSVVDQGPGIGEEVKSSLFQKFSQLQNADSMPRIGSGLGLAIASAIVKEHGGEIGVDSELGKGSTFWFALPARQQNYISPSKKGVA